MATWKCNKALSKRKVVFLQGSVHFHVSWWEGAIARDGMTPRVHHPLPVVSPGSFEPINNVRSARNRGVGMRNGMNRSGFPNKGNRQQGMVFVGSFHFSFPSSLDQFSEAAMALENRWVSLANGTKPI